MTTQDLEERLLKILSSYSSDAEDEWHSEDECHSIVSTIDCNLFYKNMDSFKTHQEIQIRLERLEERDLSIKENLFIYVIMGLIITLIFVVLWFSL
jgi:hypothetical protein